MSPTFRVRWLELVLLLLAGAVVMGGFVDLSLVDYHRVVMNELRWAGIFVASTLILSLWLGRFAPLADQIILPVVALLTGCGILIVTRLDTGLGHRQVIWTILAEGVAAAVLAFPRNVDTLRHYKYTWAFAGLILILLTIVAGTDINGSGYRRWIGFHGVYFQPVEILKPMLAIFFAAYLDEKHELLASARLSLGKINLPPFQYLGPLVAVWALSLLLLIKQNDLGSALLFLGIFLAMIYVGTSRAVYPITGMALYAVGVYAAFRLFPHIRDRTLVWLDPWSYAQTTGYQLVQGLIALASGGIGGQGLGQGHPEFVPVVTTDFILAAIGEELGLVGVVALLMLLLFLVFRGLAIALQSGDGFRKLLATGLMAILAIQTIVIVAGTTRLMPLTGVPLPFLSYGGSSALADFLIIGIMLKISGQVARENA